MPIWLFVFELIAAFSTCVELHSLVDVSPSIGLVSSSFHTTFLIFFNQEIS